MIKSINFKDRFYEFQKTNILNDKFLIQLCATSCGGYCEQFKNGNGRRVQLSGDQVQLSVSSHFSFNKKDFYFTRCYTDYKPDTERLDKKQDIVKYANKVKKALQQNTFDQQLPLFVFFNSDIKFENKDFNDYQIEMLTKRDYGYNNCLLIKSHFDPSIDFFIVSELNSFMERDNKHHTQNVKNFQKAKNILNEFVNNLGYENLFYSLSNFKFMLFKEKRKLNLEFLQQQNKILIAILFDILMRSLMLNKNNPFDCFGTVFVNYELQQKNLDLLLSFCQKYFKNLQFMCYK